MLTLTDRYGRVIRDLRISVTPRCNFRCSYCDPLGVGYKDPLGTVSVKDVAHVTDAAVALCISALLAVIGWLSVKRKVLGLQLFSGLKTLSNSKVLLFCGSTVWQQMLCFAATTND